MRVRGYLLIAVWQVASVLVWLPSSHAVLFEATDDPTYNTTAPGGTLANSGWQYEGQWKSFLGTPIAPLFFLAAKHVGGTTGDVFVLNGFTYHPVAYSDCPNCDLRVWQVAETFPLYAPLYTASNEVGRRCVVFGRGTQRGDAVTVGGQLKGWKWGPSDGLLRWGENVVSTVYTDQSVGALLQVHFDRNGAANECHLSVGDSSGAMFIQDGSTWKLAGIHYSVDGPFSLDGTTNTQFEAALVDMGGLYINSPTNSTYVPDQPFDIPSSFYSTRVSAYVSWINSVIATAPVAPVAGFAATPTFGAWPLAVVFTDTSTGTLTNRFWSFGDGSTTNTVANILTHNYSVAGTNTVSLTVSGPAGVSTMARTNYIVVVNPPQLVTGPGSRDYGTLTIGRSGTQTFQVINAGGLLLSGTATVSAPFAVSAGSPFNLSPGQTGVVAVSFSPQTAGTFSNVVIFSSNGGTSSNFVTGIGLTPGEIAVTPTNLDFGSVLTGTTAQAALTVTNTGGTAVSNGTATVGAPFSIIGGGSFAVPGFGSATVVVGFAPSGTETFNSSVNISSANGGSAIVSVTGAGASAPTTPTGLTATPVSASQINLSWNASTAPAGSRLAGYKVSRSGTQIATVTATSYADTGLLPNSYHCYTVAAYDDEGDTSIQSAQACTNTLAAPGSLLGIYNGLAIQTNAPSHASSGAIRLVLSKTGTFAANLTLGGARSAFKGQFDDSGNTTNTVARPGPNSLQVILHLDIDNRTDQITGMVSDGTFTSELLADRALFSRTNPCPWAGTYTIVLAPPAGDDPTIPQGYGYGTLTVTTTGGGKLGGVLADGTKITANVPVSKHGTWPLYEALYKNQGACVGWVTFDTNDTLEATVDWFRPPLPTSHYFPLGFTNNVTLLGQIYVSPTAGGPSPAGNRQITLGGGNLVSNILKTAVISDSGAVTISTPNSENLQLKLQPATGQFSGSFTHPSLNKTISFKGMLLQLDNFGAGYFLGTNESGFVIFEPPP